jgi:hypothetical protein
VNLVSLRVQPEPRPAIAPGTPMRKVIPPRLVGPYLNGQRAVLAGFVYRADDIRFRDPAEAYAALGLGYDGSDFTPDMSELYAVCWLARLADGYVTQAIDPQCQAADIPEFYIEPIPIPVGAAMCRLRAGGDELVAQYDGLAWQQMGE